MTCTVAEGTAALPAGAACTPTISPSNSVVLHDLNDEIDRSGSFVITNACTVAVAAQPTFTG